MQSTTASMKSQKPFLMKHNIALIAMPLLLAAVGTIGGDEISALMGLLGFLLYTYFIRSNRGPSRGSIANAKEAPVCSPTSLKPTFSARDVVSPGRGSNVPTLNPTPFLPPAKMVLRPPMTSLKPKPHFGFRSSAESCPDSGLKREKNEVLGADVVVPGPDGSDDLGASDGSNAAEFERVGPSGAGRRDAVATVRSPFEPGSMDESIRKMLKFLRPPHPSHRQYVKGIVTNVHQQIQTVLPLAKLFAFGSSFNGFGDRDSGIDLALILDTVALDKLPRQDPMYILKEIVFPALKKAGFDWVDEAMHPFAKITVTEPKDGTVVNISVNSLLPMVNTKFLRQYALIDRRVHELVLIIKRWARARNLLGDSLSSYAWTMLVIFFLQYERIVPSLQQLAKTAGHGKSQSWLQEVPSWKQMLMRDESIDRRLLHFVDQAHCKMVWSSDAQPVENAELLHRFFNFYTNEFDWEADVVCVRLGQRQQQSSPGISVKGALAIEDPLDTFSNLNTFADLDKLRDEFKRAARQLRDKAPLKVFLMRPYNG